MNWIICLLQNIAAPIRRLKIDILRVTDLQNWCFVINWTCEQIKEKIQS